MPHDSCNSVQVHVTRDCVHVRGDIHQDLRVVVDSAFRSLQSQPGPRSLDLLQIAAGVYAVDRAVKRQPHAGNESGIRTLKLRFAVNDLEFWQRPDVTETVTQILCFLTDDNWHVAFASAGKDYIATTHQKKLDLPWTSRQRKIALYSGGLDSAAGLANRVLAGFDKYLLVTVGHHARLRQQCDEQIKQLSELTKTPLQMHATFVVRQSGGVAKRLSHQERSQRSRAFLFAASAAVVAQACDIQSVEVFENGVGAINLPLMTGMLAGGLATRGAHPIHRN